MIAARHVGLTLILSLAALTGLTCCDKGVSSGEGRAWTISTEPGRDGPRLTFKTDCRVENEESGKIAPLEVRISGDATPDWAANPMTQQVTIRLISIGGPVIPEQTLSFLPDGNKRTKFGDGQAASESRQTAQGPVTCPTFVATGPAAVLRSLTGSRFAVGSVGGLTFRLSDDQVRGIAELLRRIDGSLPR